MKSRGFTLLELMIVVVIIAILAAFAAFNYSRYAMRARRADGKEMLMRVASAEERYFTNFNKYVTDDLTKLGFSAGAPCNVLGASEKCYYVVTVAQGATKDTQSYQLTGTPQAPAQNKDACQLLRIDNNGAKSFTGNESNGKCW